MRWSFFPAMIIVLSRVQTYLYSPMMTRVGVRGSNGKTGNKLIGGVAYGGSDDIAHVADYCSQQCSG